VRNVSDSIEHSTFKLILQIFERYLKPTDKQNGPGQPCSPQLLALFHSRHSKVVDPVVLQESCERNGAVAVRISFQNYTRRVELKQAMK
jgi:hypothetical protein